MKITVIEEGSPAFEELRNAFRDGDTYKISLEVRPDGLAIKTNEYMWTPALDTERDPK